MPQARMCEVKHFLVMYDMCMYNDNGGITCVLLVLGETQCTCRTGKCDVLSRGALTDGADVQYVQISLR